jgi:hypothetical protein
MSEEISPLENHNWWMEQLRKDAKANRPEALRLARELEACPTINYKDHAAELRRLHAELVEYERWSDRDEARATNAERERDIAEAQRDELLEALKAERTQYEHTLALQQKSYEREIKIEVEAEREGCAKVCEDIGNTWALDCAAAIRARGQT